LNPLHFCKNNKRVYQQQQTSSHPSSMASLRRSITPITISLLLRRSPKVSPFTPISTAFYSAFADAQQPMLVRDFIHSALYHPNYGYFSKRSGPVGVLETSIKFNQLQGRKAYLQHLNKIYKQSDISWFTPVELFKMSLMNCWFNTRLLHFCDLLVYTEGFWDLGYEYEHELDCVCQDTSLEIACLNVVCSTMMIKLGLSFFCYKTVLLIYLLQPWYAQWIAEAIMRTANLSVPLKIYEIGGGSGTCAKGIMDYIMLNAPPRVYNTMTYTSVEISPSLAEKQKETVGQVQSHKSRFKVECRDAADRNGWGDVQKEPCWVIMLEVLDNLPHDLIFSENQVSPWKEVWVEKQPDGKAPSECYRPLEDRLISRCIEILGEDINGPGQGLILAARSIWSKVFPKPRRCWLPTGCLKLLETLHSAVPKMSIIASDFSYLPDVKIPGVRAPLVSTKIDGRNVDEDSYLDAQGDADIFFPTDFWLLERIDHYCSGWTKPSDENPTKKGRKRRTITLDTSAFMEEFGLPTKTRTKDGYNPLLDDFKNTKFYISVPTHNTK
ncbi:hypothetical protein KSS87_004126, partial [Heliosperma pusillum]